MLPKSLVAPLGHNDRCTHGIVIKWHMSCCSPFSVIEKQNDPAAAAYLCVSGSRCPMLIIRQNVEIWIVPGSFGVSTFVHVLRRCSHGLHQ